MQASVTVQSRSVDQPISPTAQAADARAKAASLDGKDRAYWLWLAGEWDKSAARQGQPNDERPRSGVDQHA
jgi:hypothetical protein